jgi:maltooligosyltrehalose trehalohydrolase
MGQEFATSTPFLFFTDHNKELGKLVTEGRRSEFGGFRAFADEKMRELIPDPQAESTFLASKLKLEEREINKGINALYRELIALRLNDPVLRVPDRQLTSPEPLGASAIAVRRWVGTEHRLLIANFGAALSIRVGDVLGLEDVQHGEWTMLISTSEERFGGPGYPAGITGRGPDRIIQVPARTAAILASGA